jgi:hypothetical protein
VEVTNVIFIVIFSFISNFINSVMKKIVIICQGRTGSTNLSDFYKKKYKIKNMGEVFRNLNCVKDPEHLINELTKKPNWIVKLIPLQVLHSAFVSFINKKYSQLSFNNSTRVFSIAPTSASYVIYTRGTRRVITDTRSVTIPNTTGLYYIYFDPSGVLQYRTSFYDWPNDCMTAYVYWNADNQTAPFVADERHGITLDWQTHEYLHRTRGAAYANGFTASNYILMGDGSLDTHIQLNVANGTFFDEDLQVDIVHSNTPAPNTWEQDLQGPARIPIFYKIGNAWVIDSPTNFPVKQGAALPRYNLNTAGVWSVADIDNNKYGLTFIIATNNINYPVIGVIGQSSHSNESDAINTDFNELDLTGFPVVELRPLYKLIYDVKSSYSNTVKARLTKVTDLRNIQSVQLNNI